MPIKAHEASERTYHYGPSEIIETVDLDDIKIYLCRYKDWFSLSTVNKRFLKWYSRGGDVQEIKADEKVTWGYCGSQIEGYGFLMRFYGYVNDEEISTITLEVQGANGNKVLEYKLDDDHMFIFYCNEDKEDYSFQYLRGLNDAGEVVYEHELR